MSGLFRKSIREMWLGMLLVCIAMFAFKALLTLILPQVLENVGDILIRMEFARTMISSLLGINIETEITAQMLQAILWVHPVVLALVWTWEISFCTRMPAGEIDRGTIDILLGLPVSRRMVYACESALWIVSGIVLLGAGALGHMLVVRSIAPEYRPSTTQMLLVLVNFFALYVAVGGVVYLVSACSDRRGRAVLISLAVLLCSFLLNFLTQLWEPARLVSFLGVLSYYRPAEIIRTGSLPVGDIAVLLAVGLATWTAGAEITARRSICTV